MSIRLTAAAAFTAAFLAAGHAAAQGTPSARAAADSASAHAAGVAFIEAFSNQQWDAFRGYFADDMTMFFPFGDTPGRADGKAAVEARFRRFFDQAREAWTRSGRTGEPRLGIQPNDLRVQMAGGDVAVVSFHLGNGSVGARRSVVFQRIGGEWKVIHWHASAAPPVPAAPATPAPATPAPATPPAN